MRKRYLVLIVIILLLVAVVGTSVWKPPTTSVRRDFQMTTWGTAVNWEPLDPSTAKVVLVRRRFWSHAGDAVFSLLLEAGPRFWFDDRNGMTARVPPARAKGGWFDPWGRSGDCYWLRELGLSSASSGLRLVRETFLGCRLP